MTEVVVLAGALGIALFAAGIPLGRQPALRKRVDPYLSGVRGRPSSLLSAGTPPTSLLRRRALEIVGRWHPRSSERLTERLAMAGESDDAAGFRLTQIAWGAAATAGTWLGIAALSGLGAAVDVRAVPVITLIAFCLGALGRNWWLSRQIEARRAIFQDQLPTAIDLITLVVMAGESVPAAFERVANLMGPGIGEEFLGAIGEIRAGARVTESLEALKGRMPIPAVSRLVDALITGIERGSPLGEVLAAQADDGREARRRALLEMGGRREVVMLVPIVFFVMPVVVVFALLPGLVSLDLLVP